MSHYDAAITKPEGLDEDIFERLRPQVVPLTQKFEAGRGRPDLERLYEVVHSLDRGFPSILDIRNDLVTYLNTRPEEK